MINFLDLEGFFSDLRLHVISIYISTKIMEVYTAC